MGVKRYATVAGLVAALCAVAAASVAASQPRAQLRGLVCQKALDPPARAVGITAEIRPLTKTKQMQLKFQFLMRTKPHGKFVSVSAGDLGSWISPSNPTLGQRSGDVWIVHKQVVDVSAPAQYRFRVSFRWFGAHGHALGTTTRQSAICTQPELRPDLLVQSITVQPVTGRPKVNRYVAVIRNAGASAAGPFEILFTPGGALPVQTVSVSGLAAHAKLTRSFLGPVCSNASATSVTVDPNDKVDDLNRSNNTLTAVCPGATTTP
jgi:hypothetical protein